MEDISRIRISELNIEEVSMAVLNFNGYFAPYLESPYPILNLTIQSFRFMMDSLEKIEILLEESNKLINGELNSKCIGENEDILFYKDGFIQFYTIALSSDICLELKESIWISLLQKIKLFMLDRNNSIVEIKF